MNAHTYIRAYKLQQLDYTKTGVAEHYIFKPTLTSDSLQKKRKS